MNASRPGQDGGRGSGPARSCSAACGNDPGRRVPGTAAGTVAVGAATAALVLLLAGCGSGGSSTASGTTTSPVPTPTWTLSYAPEPGASLTASARAAELLHQAKVAMADTVSVHVQGLLTFDRRTVLLDLNAGESGATGTMRAGDGTAQTVITQHTLYLKGDQDFWRAFEGGDQPVLTGKWARVSEKTSPIFGAVLDVFPVQEWVERIAPVEDKQAELPGKTIDGQATVGVRRLDNGAAETLYLSTGTTVRPVLIVPAQGGALQLSRWDAKIPEAKAPVRDVLDVSRTALGG